MASAAAAASPSSIPGLPDDPLSPPSPPPSLPHSSFPPFPLSPSSLPFITFTDTYAPLPSNPSAIDKLFGQIILFTDSCYVYVTNSPSLPFSNLFVSFFSPSSPDANDPSISHVYRPSPSSSSPFGPDQGLDGGSMPSDASEATSGIIHRLSVVLGIKLVYLSINCAPPPFCVNEEERSQYNMWVQRSIEKHIKENKRRLKKGEDVK